MVLKIILPDFPAVLHALRVISPTMIYLEDDQGHPDLKM